MTDSPLLSLKDFPKATQLFEAVFSFDYRVIIYGGAIRGGKTFNILGCAVVLLRMFPGARIAIVRKDLAMLKKATLPSVKKVFPSKFLKLIDSTSYIWEADNKQYGADLNGQIFFFGENYEKDKELTRWDGLEVNFILIDQLDGITQNGFTKALERVGAYIIPGLPKDQQPPPMILASLNPAKNWVKSLIYERWKAGTLPKTWTFIPAFITDNPFIPDAYKENLEQLRGTNPQEYERRVKGNWDYADDPSALIDPDAIKDFFSNEYTKGETAYISADVARYGRDKSVILVWKGLRIVDYLVLEQNSLKEFKDNVLFLARKYKVARSRIIIDSDGLGGGPVDEIKCKAFVNNSEAMGKTILELQKVPNNQIYANLKTQCGYLLAEYMNRGALAWELNDPLIEQMVKEELEQIREMHVGADRKKRLVPKEEVKLVLGRSPDFSDAILERMFFEINPRPKISAATM